jgi:glycosyltransferase involved in cell wall biosynthesis
MPVNSLPNNINVDPLISICIPTFNRAEKVYRLVNDLLRYEGDDIEIVVLDNCSTDQTQVLMTGIKDARLKYIENERNVGGPINLLKALTFAKGEYGFMCLDKDRLDPEKIRNLISRIQSDPHIVFGYCGLNLTEETNDVIYSQGYESLMNMAYLSSHPTGMFYKMSILKAKPKLAEIFHINKKFGFYTDILNGEMAMSGAGKVINLPIFYTESKDDSAKITSFTYNEKDLYFAPNQRINEFNMYAKSASQLDLGQVEQFKLLRILFIRAFIAATAGYKTILNDHKVCEHYNINSRKVGVLELVKICSSFCVNLLTGNLPLTFTQKLSTSLSGFFGLYKNLLKRTS